MRVTAAVILIVAGLVKKVAIADYLAREVVDPVFAVPEAYAAPDVAFAAYAFAAQVYCDFSGYTDIAIGLALLMGIVFPQNFNRPNSATSVADFWRRWHMTLTRFLRDYVYIPLGGNRGGRLKRARNLFVTLLLAGLWHGAAWTFVVFGAIHGAALAIERELADRFRAPPKWLAWLIVFHIWVLSLIFFRSETIEIAFAMYQQLTVVRARHTVRPRALPRDRWRHRHPERAQALAGRPAPARGRAPPGGAWRRPHGRHHLRRRDDPEPGRPAIHLLPVLMKRDPVHYVPDPPPGPRLRARDALIVVGVVTLLLLLFEGDSVRRWGDQMGPGIGRDIVTAVGEPVGWVADQLPFADAADEATNWLASEDDLGDAGGFDAATETSEAPEGARIPPVSPESFDPVALGEPVPKLELDTLLVTGDSMVLTLDTVIARELAGSDVKVIRDPHVGTGISKSGLVDWGKLSTKQVADDEPDAVVVFVGAGEGFPLPGPGGRDVECCGPDYAALYAARVRQMMDTYRQGGAARVYWMRIPTPRDDDVAEIIRTVNASIDVASVPWRAHVRVIDLGAVFTPDGSFRSAMDVDGREEIVRDPDGLHLSAKGGEVAADVVLDAIRRDFPDQLPD